MLFGERNEICVPSGDRVKNIVVRAFWEEEGDTLGMKLAAKRKHSNLPEDPVLRELALMEPVDHRIPETARAITGALRGAFPKSTVADFVGISESSVGRLWMEEDLSQPRVEIVKKNLAGKFYLRAAAALDFLTPEKLAKLNAYQLILTAGIALDKARLIEGLSTENINFKSLAVTLNAELATLRETKQVLLDSLGGERPLIVGG